MLAKKGDTLVDQGGNSYSVNALMLSGRTSIGCGIFEHTVNGKTNVTFYRWCGVSLEGGKVEPIAVVSCHRQCGDAFLCELDCIAVEGGRVTWITELA